jgi:hypothetical protein
MKILQEKYFSIRMQHFADFFPLLGVGSAYVGLEARLLPCSSSTYVPYFLFLSFYIFFFTKLFFYKRGRLILAST